jgi:hypothetical protein
LHLRPPAQGENGQKKCPSHKAFCSFPHAVRRQRGDKYEIVMIQER